MLISRLISLTAETSYPILGALGRPAQAWFLRQVTSVNPGLASALHDESGLKPYTVSTLLDDNGRPLAAGSWLQPGQECWLRITTLNEALSETLESKILKRLPERLTLYKMNFRINGVARRRAEHPWADGTSFDQIAQDSALATANGSVRLEFASPTAFRSNGLDICVPYPGQVFRSLWAKWNEFCPEPMQVQDVWPGFAEDCIYINEVTALNSTHWTFAEGTRGDATGFHGTVGFYLPARKSLPEKWRDFTDGAPAVMQSLARFGFYAGVGHHATIGMGQVRVLPKA
jgi:CRISPR-associated endoribonuclease Cas6